MRNLTNKSFSFSVWDVVVVVAEKLWWVSTYLAVIKSLSLFCSVSVSFAETSSSPVLSAALCKSFVSMTSSKKKSGFSGHSLRKPFCGMS